MKKQATIYTPHHYQTEATKWLIEKSEPSNGGGAALFLAMGLGKTSSTLQAFKQLKDSGRVKTMLIVAPLRVAQTTWLAEVAKWSEFNNLTYIVVHGKDKEALLKKQVDIYIINYEGLAWLTTQKWQATDIICFDELTRMKNWSSGRVKAIKPFLPLFKRRWGLTGSPVPNGLYDLFSQVYMLDLGRRFGPYITKFRTSYFKPPTIYAPFKNIPYDNSVELIYDKIKDLAFRIEAEDWLTIPTEVHNPILLELPPKLKKDYNVLKKESIVALEAFGGVVTATTAATLSTKLRQFLSGAVYLADREVAQVHTHKLDALKDFVEDIDGNPVLVGYQYQHEIARFKDAFPKATFIESSTKASDLNRIITKWNNGDIPLLFGHPQSIGHGLNMQGACNNIIFYSLDFNLDNFLQFIKRVARQGQKETHVFIHYLIFAGTIDEYLMQVLTEKETVQNTLLDFLRIEI
jgi:SNF2 family DNA or RNA helicase